MKYKNIDSWKSAMRKIAKERNLDIQDVQQRIAFARLLIKPCDLILCDEPTGNLDDMNKEVILDLLSDLKSMGKTIVIVTHGSDVLKLADEVYMINKNTREL